MRLRVWPIREDPQLHRQLDVKHMELAQLEAKLRDAENKML